MEQIGRVMNAENGYVKVQVTRKSACGEDCSKCAGCAPMGVTIDAKDSLGAEIGEHVIIASEQSYLRKAVLWVYIVPLLAFVVGAILGTVISQEFGWEAYQELVQIALGFGMMGLAYAYTHNLDKRIKERDEYSFEVVKVIGRD